MTLPRVRRQERADDPAPAPTLSSDLWLPWRVTPLCVCAPPPSIAPLTASPQVPRTHREFPLEPWPQVPASATPPPSTKPLQSPVASSPGFVVIPCSMADLARTHQALAEDYRWHLQIAAGKLLAQPSW